MSKMQDMVLEWSYLFDTEELEDKPVKLVISPSLDEKVLIARRLGVGSLERLSSELRVAKIPGSMVVHVAGTLKADITQTCVVSGEPLSSHIEEGFDGWFADKAVAVSLAKARQEKMIAKGQSEVPLVEEHDDPEPIIDGQIDLGELSVQYLALAVDPYPRGAEVSVEYSSQTQEEGGFSFKNPFAALKEWKTKQTGQE